MSYIFLLWIIGHLESLSQMFVQISVVLLKLLPLPGTIPPDGFALFTTCFILGLFSLFFR